MVSKYNRLYSDSVIKCITLIPSLDILTIKYCLAVFMLSIFIPNEAGPDDLCLQYDENGGLHLCFRVHI